MPTCAASLCVSPISMLRLLTRKVETIMCDGSTIIRERQLAVRRELDRRGIALKVVGFDSKIPYATLLSYFPLDKQPAQIPGGALFQLYGAIPDDLMSLLVPQGWAVVRMPDGIDYDQVSSLCREFIDAKDKAHHPDSEAGRDIGPSENAVLAGNVVKLAAVA